MELSTLLSILKALSTLSILSGLSIVCFYLRKLSKDMAQVVCYQDVASVKLTYLERRADAAESHPQDILRCQA